MHVEHGLELLVGHFLDRRVPGITGIVDDDVEAAQLFHRSADKTIGKPCVGNAAVDGDGLAARGDDFSGDRTSPGAASRSLTTMLAPSLASFNAMARPIPRPDPVINATFPASLVIRCP
jgi:hypothetical protein